MALNALFCPGNDVSPKHRSVLRAIHPLNSLKKNPACSGGRRPSIEDDGVGRKALCVALVGNFCRR
jgi:hypothetical protein